jgi:hypothetical protein
LPAFAGGAKKPFRKSPRVEGQVSRLILLEIEGPQRVARVEHKLPPAEIVFTAEERVLIGNWYRGDRSGLPPGLAKPDRLPPGLEKQLRERGTRPPGLQKNIQPFPVDLERQMRRLPTGYRRVVIAGNVILMNEMTAVIYDIIRNVECTDSRLSRQ